MSNVDVIMMVRVLVNRGLSRKGKVDVISDQGWITAGSFDLEWFIQK